MFGIEGRLQGGVTAATGILGGSAGGSGARQALEASRAVGRSGGIGTLDGEERSLLVGG